MKFGISCKIWVWICFQNAPSSNRTRFSVRMVSAVLLLLSMVLASMMIYLMVVIRNDWWSMMMVMMVNSVRIVIRMMLDPVES